MDHKYANSNSIFGIQIHELAYTPIFKFANFIAELMTLTDLCDLCHLWHKWQKHIDVCIPSENLSRNFQSLYIMKIWYLKQCCSHSNLSICVSATCATSDTSVTHLSMSITQLENVRML